MPELPEVETIARGLAKRVTGEVIESSGSAKSPNRLNPPRQKSPPPSKAPASSPSAA